MNEMQQRLTKMLGWFHTYCENHNLRYYLIYGTMLGAVRHKGFIPWDDDIDVGMPRADYERLRQLCKTEGPGQYMFEFPGNDNPEYTTLWAKLFDTTTTLIEEQRHPIARGIYIDVFPLDGAGQTYKEAVKNFKPIKRHRILNNMICCGFLKRRAWYKNISILIGRIISPLLINRAKLNQKINFLCKKQDFDEYEYVGCLMDMNRLTSLMPRWIYGKPTPIQFGEYILNGVEHPDKYLSTLYGDYMQLPPEEKRVSRHDRILLDLNKGYKN